MTRGLEVWRCPGCDAEVRALAALDVLHWCPKRKGKQTSFHKVEDET